MAKVHYQGKAVELYSSETVLDGLLRSGHFVPHSCKSGVCHSCLMKTTGETPPAAAQTGLRDVQKAARHFLACLCRPEEDLGVEDLGAESMFDSVVLDSSLVGVDVLRLRLAAPSGFDFIPGQFATLIRPDGLARSYSLAGLPADDRLEFHIRRMPGGAMSNWIHDEVKPGDSISVRGPSGTCFYVPGRPHQPLLLAGTGTGLAPLLGILRDALQRGHTGPIHLIHGGLVPERIYLMEELRRIEEAASNVTYQAVVLNGPVRPGMEQGAADMKAIDWVGTHPGARIFLCGAPEFVNMLRKKLFLGGASMADILADAFVTAKPPPPPLP